MEKRKSQSRLGGKAYRRGGDGLNEDEVESEEEEAKREVVGGGDERGNEEDEDNEHRLVAKDASHQLVVFEGGEGFEEEEGDLNDFNLNSREALRVQGEVQDLVEASLRESAQLRSRVERLQASVSMVDSAVAVLLVEARVLNEAGVSLDFLASPTTTVLVSSGLLDRALQAHARRRMRTGEGEGYGDEANGGESKMDVGVPFECEEESGALAEVLLLVKRDAMLVVVDQGGGRHVATFARRVRRGRLSLTPPSSQGFGSGSGSVSGGLARGKSSQSARSLLRRGGGFGKGGDPSDTDSPAYGAVRDVDLLVRVATLRGGELGLCSFEAEEEVGGIVERLGLIQQW